MALETPQRIDALLAERAAQPAAERLHVLAGEEQLTSDVNYTAGAMASLLAALRRRYNFIVADVSFRRAQMYDDLSQESHQRVFVMSPTLASVRATLRLLSLPAKSQAPRPVIVLNRVGSPGSLTRRQVEDAMAVKVDVAVPDLPRQVANAATMGELAVTIKGGFRDGIVELASRVAFVGLLDSTAVPGSVAAEASAPRGWRLFRRKP
jgi:pilus assembly protein CpaE